MENPRRRFSGRGRRHSPTRERVLRMVEAQPGAVTVAAVTAALGLHENTVRGHLDELHADGYLVRERGPAVGRGRPPWQFRAAVPAPRSPYAGLASALARTLAATSPEPIAAARTAGLAWGDELAAEQPDGVTPVEAVMLAMREHGFEPEDRGEEVALRQCPLLEAATAHPEIVCAVHQGLVDGILSAHGEQGRSRLLPFTAPGECTVHLPPP